MLRRVAAASVASSTAASALLMLQSREPRGGVACEPASSPPPPPPARTPSSTNRLSPWWHRWLSGSQEVVLEEAVQPEALALTAEQRRARRELRRRRREARLREQGGEARYANIEPEPSRHVVVVVGITGSGKSSTANTMMTRGYKMHQLTGEPEVDMVKLGERALEATRGRNRAEKKEQKAAAQPAAGRAGGQLQLQNGAAQKPQYNRKFVVSEGITSETRSVTYRDYSFCEVPFRVVDTPGFSDTNRDPEQIRRELTNIAMCAPHGISSFLVVLPMGRVTQEHADAIAEVERLFGRELFAKHAVVVCTSASAATNRKQLLTRDQLLESIDQLPPDHFLRRFVRKVGYRVVPVENKMPPHLVSQSQLVLNQAVLDTIEANEGKRIDCSQFLDDDGEFVAEKEAGALPASAALPQGLQCSTRRASVAGGKLVLEIECQLPSA